MCHATFCCQILLFPEGTDLTPASKVRSDRYAEKHNLPKLDRVLHPKTTGFAFLAQRLRSSESILPALVVSCA